ncbi:MAG: hypothetical protein V1760_01720, partial [Candidatus Peregrinibacteria bacterium]
ANKVALIISFDLITPLTTGLVSGVITAAILYFLYRKIFVWVQGKSFGKYLNTFFKLVFYPYLIVALVLALLGSLASLMGALIMLITGVAGHFAYAKVLDLKIGKYFEAQTADPSPAAPTPAV